MNGAAMNMITPVFEYLFSVSLSIYIQVELLRHIIITCLAFSGRPNLFSTAAEPFYFPTTAVQVFQFLHVLANPCCTCYLNYYRHLGHLGGSVGWVSDFGSGHDLTAHGFKPHVGLCADGSEPGVCFGF